MKRKPYRMSKISLIVILLFSVITGDHVQAASNDIPKDNTVQNIALGGIIGYFLWTMYDTYFGKVKISIPAEVKDAIVEVQFIATKNELKQLKKIRDKNELKSFMYNFWLRRDPTPGTAVNEYKISHMNRVKIANERFSWGLSPGASTDMGRVYILYGDPFEINRMTDSSLYFNYPKFNNSGLQESPMIIWYYNVPSASNSVQTVFGSLGKGETVFVFMDLQKVGDYSQVYSNKRNEYIDSRVFLTPGSFN